ncbi:MAG: hypothetical protein WCK47_05500 [bacterium]|nr:hypothetical protein [Candidatus Sumerlaeota bacterium]
MPGFKPETTTDDVFALLDILEKNGVRGWLHGGWAIDALTGQGRLHGDIDLFARQRDRGRITALLAEYVVKQAIHKIKLNFQGALADFSFFSVMRGGIVIVKLSHYTVTLPAGAFSDVRGTIAGRGVPVISPVGLYCEIGERWKKPPEMLAKNVIDLAMISDLLTEDQKTAARRYFRENQPPWRRALVFLGLMKSF